MYIENTLLCLGALGLLYAASCILVLIALQVRRLLDLCGNCRGRRAECIDADIGAGREFLQLCGRWRYRRCHYTLTAPGKGRHAGTVHK